MKLLVFNCGSSSLTFKLYKVNAEAPLETLFSGKVGHIGSPALEGTYLQLIQGGKETRQPCAALTHREAGQAALEAVQRAGYAIDGFGHRFVQGGNLLRESCIIDAEVCTKIETCLPLAPIHNPNSYSLVQLVAEKFPQAPQYACFDTAFHASLPESAWRYALPMDLCDAAGYRKFGFHGISYQYVTQRTAELLHIPLEQLNLVACHLGTGGSSVAAIKNGKSVDTSMGYTPLAGLIMSTRCGDIDPEITISLIRDRGMSPAEVEDLFNHRSGLIAISGSSSDLFELTRLAEVGDSRARLAVDMYTHRLKLNIGAALACLDRVDALVFTDTLGARCWQIREQACCGLAWMGLKLDTGLNRLNQSQIQPVISSPDSTIKILIQDTDEESMIAREGQRLLTEQIAA